MKLWLTLVVRRTHLDAPGIQETESVTTKSSLP